MLNVRNKGVIEMEPIVGTFNGDAAAAEIKLFRLSFDLGKMTGSKVYVSQYGNHRLEYAAGDCYVMDSVPFQLHMGLNRDQERSLFVDINADQKGLNSSHLAIMQGRLTAEETEIAITATDGLQRDL